MLEFWYLYHSGFAIKMGQTVLIFDYYLDTPAGGGLEDGVVPADFLKRHDVTVFASHAHGDHYNPVIFEWAAHNPAIRYVLSDDIPPKEDAVMTGPGRTLELAGMTVKTFASNDEGVAFLVHAGGKTLYHAGDLNWWRWEGEPDDYNRDLETRYKEQIELLAGVHIDLAFLPVDPRLRRHYALGADHFMRRVGSDWMVPMHFGDRTEICRRFFNEPAAAPYRDRIVTITRRGDHFTI